MNIQKLLYQNVVWRGLFYISGFLLNIFIARKFEALLTGQLYYLVSWFALITLVISASMESGMLYYASKKEIAVTKLFNFSIVWVAAAGVILSLSFVLISVGWPGSITFPVFIFAIVFICGNLLMTFIGNLWYAGKNFILSNRAGIGVNIILIILLFFVNENSWLTHVNYLYFYFASFLFLGILLTVLMLPRFNRPIVFTLPGNAQLKMLLSYSLVAFSANIISFFLYRIDYWFVHKYCSAQHLGEYIQVSKIVQMFFLLPSMFATVLFPLTASGQREQANDMVLTLSRSLFLLYGFVCLVLAITGRWLFPFVYGETFSDMYIPFLFLVPGILAFSSLYVLAAYYAGKDRVMVNVKGCSLAFLCVFMGDAFLIPRYGIKAAAAVSSLGYVIYFTYVLSVFKKEYTVPLKSFFYFKLSDLKKYKDAFKPLKQ